jgi:ParD-like antitoxin of type II bacterial toxin-antitoxin system
MLEALVSPPVAPSHLSVKLPTALVSAAKESAQTFRRSTAGQIEYWAALGRKMEASGLTILQAEQALKQDTAGHVINNEANTGSDSLEAHMAKMSIANSSGVLKRQFHTIVTSNRSNEAPAG